MNKTLCKLSDYVKQGGKTYFTITTPKTKNSVRDIPMLEKVKEALFEQRKNRDKLNAISIDGYQDFVFTSRTGNVFYSENIRTVIKSIADRINKAEAAAAGGQGASSI